jgi:succinyl-CoA synthetase alpha subunit
VVLIGEIGGDGEERAAEWIAANMPGVLAVVHPDEPRRQAAHGSRRGDNQRRTGNAQQGGGPRGGGARVADAPSQIPQLLLEMGVRAS